MNAAKNFPNTIPVIVTGEVRSNCSVRIFRSSEKSFMVSSGISTIKAKIIIWKNAEVS